jgi:glycosyltransferase involved in cell wall biosynthesis
MTIMRSVVSMTPASPGIEPSRWTFLVPPPAAPTERGTLPSFSVVIPAYNVAQFLAEAISSALSQTLPALEVIVVDDGSTDDIDKVVAPFRERIRYLHQPNWGEAAAKNAGARAAHGDFVAFFDGDDVQAPERLEALGRLAVERPDLDILTTRCWRVQGDIVLDLYPADGVFGVHDQRREVLEREFLPSAAIRRTSLRAIGGFDERLSHNTDVDCLIRLVLSGSRAGCVDAPLFSYRRRPGQLTEDEVTDKEQRIAMLERLARRTDLDELDVAAITRAMRAARLDLARAMVRSGHPGARGAALRVALEQGNSVSTRLKAAASAIAPRLGRHARRT